MTLAMSCIKLLSTNHERHAIFANIIANCPGMDITGKMMMLSDTNLSTDGGIVEDLERILQRDDLLLPASHAVLVADGLVHTIGLKLLVIVQGGVELLLRPLQVRLLLRERLLLVLLGRGLVLDVLLLLRLVDVAVVHELVVLLLRRFLVLRGLGLEAREIALDHLEHCDTPAALPAHPLVGLVEDL